jgi:chitinase
MDTLDTELTKTRKSNVTKLVTTQPTVNLYDPANDRVSNAVSSITSFMSTYSLDGIDIDYQTEMSIEVRIARTC